MGKKIVASPWVVPNGGIDESLADHVLAPNKWAAALNAEPLSTGVRRRNGTTQILTAPGNKAITAIADFLLSDGQTERQLFMAGQNLYKEVGGAITQISANDFTENADTHPSIKIGRDTAWITNGVDQPKKLFLIGGADTFCNDGIAPPTANVTAAAVAGGTMTAGDWYVDFYYYDSALSIKSNTRYQGVQTLKVTLAAANLSIQLTNLPSAVVRAGDRATHLRITLNKPGSGVFRYAGDAQGQLALGGGTTLTITAENLGAIPDYDDDVAPVHSIAAVGANQRFIAGIPGFPFRVMSTKINLIGAFYESVPALNLRDFGKGDGDYVTALTFIPPATLIVGMRNSVWALDARRFLLADPVQIGKNVGIAGPQAFTVVGRELFWISASDRTKGLFKWDGARVVPLLNLDRTFKSLSMPRLKYASCAQLNPGDTRFQWWTACSSVGATDQDTLICLDYGLDAFTVYKWAHSANVIGTIATGATSASIRVGTSNGKLLTADSGDDDNGTAINAFVTLRRNDYEAPDVVKRIRFVRAEGESSAGAPMVVTFEPDDAFASFSTQLDFALAGSSPTWGSAVWGAFDWAPSSSSVIQSKQNAVVGVARNVQPTFSASGRWKLRGFTIGVQPLGRKI